MHWLFILRTNSEILIRCDGNNNVSYINLMRNLKSTKMAILGLSVLLPIDPCSQFFPERL